MPFVIPLSTPGSPLFVQVYQGLRRAILAGNLEAGDKLPSTRELAEQLGVSRTVTLLAYDRLTAEGFATAQRGSGTHVSPDMTAGPRSGKHFVKLRLSRYGGAVVKAQATVDTPRSPSAAPLYNFGYGRSDLSSFPFSTWRRLLLRNMREASARQFDYGAALGNSGLREAICAHLRRSRAVVCEPSQVLIVSGSQQALDLIVRVLVNPGDSVAIEEPHYDGARETLRAAGARLRPVPIDRDGLDPGCLPDDAVLAFVTPSHQFPTGAILPLERRLALLDWARRRGSVIVEDDYDGEFRYDGRPLESLQGLDPEGRTIYLGTFSRTVFPSLRIGYLVAPGPLMAPLTAAKWLSDLHSATLEQGTLGEFITSGGYERHLRRLRRRNTLRRTALLDAVRDFLRDRVELTGSSAGAHVVLWPRRRVSESKIIEQAMRCGVGISGIAHCWLGPPARPGFILGYARLAEPEIREGIRLLAKVL
jgi:GntR family transcriptional regulator / MocR family aminotransferase